MLNYFIPKAEKIKSVAGVFVVHQVKEHIPVKFENEVIILNLWHGVGIKPIERLVDSPGIRYRTYKNISSIMRCIIITNYFWSLHRLWNNILLKCLIWMKVKSSEQVIQQICLIKLILNLLIILLSDTKV